MPKVIKLSGKFRTTEAAPVAFTPTHDRPLGALTVGPGSSWSRDRYEVWTVVDGTSARSTPGSYSTFEDASKFVSESVAYHRRMGAFIEQGGCTYRIVRARGTCEVVG